MGGLTFYNLLVFFNFAFEVIHLAFGRFYLPVDEFPTVFFTSLVTGLWSLNNVYLGSSFSAIHVSLKTTDKEISASIFFFCVQKLQLIQIMLEYY